MGSQYIREVVRMAIAPNSIIINAFSFYAARERTCRTDHLDLNRPLNYLNTDQTGRKSKIRSRQTQRVTDRFETESATTIADYLQLFLSLLYEYRDALIRAVNCCVRWLMVIEQRHDNDGN